MASTDYLVVPECRKCGDCCLFVLIPVHDPSALTRDIMHYLQLHGISVERYKGRLHYHLNISCSKLSPDGLCTIYEDRPECCRRGECFNK